MPRAILHIGMNKTGSTSIQHSLTGYDDGVSRYARLSAPNHSQPLSTIFMERPENSVNWKRIGAPSEKIRAARNKFRDQLDAELSHDRRTFILSAEELCMLDHREVENLKAYFEARDIAVEVIAYVREPIGFASSALQQRIKSGLAKFGVAQPHYRFRFESYLDVFGRSGVRFLPFSRADFDQGSVVRDFARRLNLDLGSIKERTANESIAAPLVAILFFWNQHPASIVNSQDTVVARRLLIRELSPHFDGKFRLSDAIIRRKLDEEDIRWMEQESGIRLMPDAAPVEGEGVSGEADLEVLTAQTVPILSQMLRDKGLVVPPDGDPLKMMTRLYRMFLRQRAEH